jgi:hypothetical protein
VESPDPLQVKILRALAELNEGRSGLRTASKRIRELATLEPDWDSYGAKQLSGLAVSIAYDLLLQLDEPAVRTLSFIAPLATGGLQFEWESEHRSLEVEMHGDGRIGYLLVSRALDGSRHAEERDDVSLDQVIAVVDAFISSHVSSR